MKLQQNNKMKMCWCLLHIILSHIARGEADYVESKSWPFEYKGCFSQVAEICSGLSPVLGCKMWSRQFCTEDLASGCQSKVCRPSIRCKINFAALLHFLLCSNSVCYFIFLVFCVWRCTFVMVWMTIVFHQLTNLNKLVTSWWYCMGWFYNIQVMNPWWRK